MTEEVETVSKSTWKSRNAGMNKSEIKRLYEELSRIKTSSERGMHMRRMIHFPPEHEPVFANLIKMVNRTFENCDSYKSECYKQFRNILNAFQESFGESGEAMRFTLKRSPTPATPTTSAAPATSAAPVTMRSPTTCMMPPPLPPSVQTLVLNLSDLKLEMFVTAFIMCANEAQRKQFIKRYVHAVTPDGEPFPAFVDDIETDLNFIATEMELNESSEAEIKKALVEHLKYTNETNLDTNICILYPFPNTHGLQRKGPLSVRNLGGSRSSRRRRMHAKSKKCKK